MPLSLAHAADAAPAPSAAPADSVSVKIAGSPGYSLTADATSGGISVLDGIDTRTTATISGTATLAGGAVFKVDITANGSTYQGSVGLTDGTVAINGTVNGAVTRTDDETVTWTTPVTLTSGGTTSTVPATFTVVDRVADAGVHYVTLTHDGVVRTAAVYVPAGKGGVRGLPALVHFPGLGEWAAIAAYFSELLPPADQHGYLLVIPEHDGVGWQGVPYGTTSPELDDPGYIRDLMGIVVSRFGADATRLYSSGMSNGSWFSQLMACQLSDVFAASAAVSGPLADPASCKPGRPVPVLLFHGTSDPLVAYSSVAPALAFWASNNGCATTTTDTNLPDVDPNDGTTVVEHVYNGCPAAAPVVFYQINNGGHNWPGGMPFLPFNLLGNTTQDINADQIIWNFVSQFHLN